MQKHQLQPQGNSIGLPGGSMHRIGTELGYAVGAQLDTLKGRFGVRQGRINKGRSS
jgi:hypothetical protein